VATFHGDVTPTTWVCNSTEHSVFPHVRSRVIGETEVGSQLVLGEFSGSSQRVLGGRQLQKVHSGRRPEHVI
jgi:hypothetical protein